MDVSEDAELLFERDEERLRQELWNQEVSQREPRVLWDRTNPLVQFNNFEFKRHFRFRKDTFLQVVDILEDHLEPPDPRGSPLNLVQQVALALSFYSRASFYRVIGVNAEVKTTCTHGHIHQVTNTLCSISHKFITFPSQSEMLLLQSTLRSDLAFQISLLALMELKSGWTWNLPKGIFSLGNTHRTSGHGNFKGADLFRSFHQCSLDFQKAILRPQRSSHWGSLIPSLGCVCQISWIHPRRADFL